MCPSAHCMFNSLCQIWWHLSNVFKQATRTQKGIKPSNFGDYVYKVIKGSSTKVTTICHFSGKVGSSSSLVVLMSSSNLFEICSSNYTFQFLSKSKHLVSDLSFGLSFCNFKHPWRSQVYSTTMIIFGITNHTRWVALNIKTFNLEEKQNLRRYTKQGLVIVYNLLSRLLLLALGVEVYVFLSRLLLLALEL